MCWRVEHASVYSGSFVLADAGALHDAWVPFSLDPVGYPSQIRESRFRFFGTDASMEQLATVAFWQDKKGVTDISELRRVTWVMKGGRVYKETVK